MLNLDALGREPAPDAPFRRAPTHLWQPGIVGTVDIRIDREGQWWHEGDPIRRAGLVRLLASVLICEDDTYWLKTPAEKMQIEVEDAPFVVTDAQTREDGVEVLTNVGERAVLQTPWTLRTDVSGASRPWVPLEQDLGARLTRNLYYHLVNEAAYAGESTPEGVLVWRAAGQAWPLGEL
ncbi:MAG: DUF1285 domain-containing protein [Natronospirillum sp.]|uniref:DUF1285 domain-containing protein n=1 Tax=Natronospirillum sp. TaxID=2812955 RepID=UPI0025CD005D|nr:DUF1285 domain-containing protein [Natronospirillum sp.]MCH8551030.1 DUF1285 domain-containing protein [Natronospirillum sp.]